MFLEVSEAKQKQAKTKPKHPPPQQKKNNKWQVSSSNNKNKIRKKLFKKKDFEERVLEKRESKKDFEERVLEKRESLWNCREDCFWGIWSKTKGSKNKTKTPPSQKKATNDRWAAATTKTTIPRTKTRSRTLGWTKSKQEQQQTKQKTNKQTNKQKQQMKNKWTKPINNNSKKSNAAKKNHLFACKTKACFGPKNTSVPN